MGYRVTVDIATDVFTAITANDNDVRSPLHSCQPQLLQPTFLGNSLYGAGCITGDMDKKVTATFVSFVQIQSTVPFKRFLLL